MLFELNQIITQGYKLANQGIRSVLATVVYVDGSSYRPAGVRMLVAENGQQIGALSGGCVEQEVSRQAQHVFEQNQSMIMTYDGRYRLGCKGILYIVLEPFNISQQDFELVQDAIRNRNPIKALVTYSLTEGEFGPFNTQLSWSNQSIKLSNNNEELPTDNLLQFEEELSPIVQLHILGAEHDARALCRQANFLGWDVFVYCSPNVQIGNNEFQEAVQVIAIEPEQFDQSIIDDSCAVVIMTHNYSRDLRFLARLIDSKTNYIGILGSSTRREELLHELMEQYTVDLDFFNKIYSPAGLNLGAENPEEIALSITSEILSLQRQVHVESLRNVEGKIHV